MLTKIVLLPLAAAFVLATAESAPDPFTGTWKVDPAHCRIGPIQSDPNRAVLRIEVKGDEYRTMYSDGRTLVLQLDGKAHKSAGGAFEPIQVDPVQTLFKQVSIIGSSHNEPEDVTQILDLVRTGKVKSQLELYRIGQINEVLQRLSEGKVRYRAVVCPES